MRLNHVLYTWSFGQISAWRRLIRSFLHTDFTTLVQLWLYISNAIKTINVYINLTLYKQIEQVINSIFRAFCAIVSKTKD